MANLFWKTANVMNSIIEEPFHSEEEFEKIIFDNQQIFDDIFLIKRQIRGGNKGGIPDIIGIDRDGNICIIEMKNVVVTSSIIPQVLQYAFWAETNPDSVKSLWLECEEKPDEFSISWDDFQVRIIIVAPQIMKSTMDIVAKINYPVDLIEVKRWIEGENQFLLINKLEEEKKQKIRPVIGLQEYDDEFYKKEYNKNSAVMFLKYVEEVESIIREKGWSLETKFNKHYCSFKVGFLNAFGIRWMGSKTFSFFFKITKEEVGDFKIPCTRNDEQWKEIYYYIEPGKTNTEDFIPLFEKSYKNFVSN